MDLLMRQPNTACDRKLDTELHTALALCRAGRVDDVDTVRMLEIAYAAEAAGNYFKRGAALELADMTIGWKQNRCRGA